MAKSSSRPLRAVCKAAPSAASVEHAGVGIRYIESSALDAVHLATVESLGEPPQLMAIVTRGYRVRENAKVLGYSVE